MNTRRFISFLAHVIFATSIIIFDADLVNASLEETMSIANASNDNDSDKHDTLNALEGGENQADGQHNVGSEHKILYNHSEEGREEEQSIRQGIEVEDDGEEQQQENEKLRIKENYDLHHGSWGTGTSSANAKSAIHRLKATNLHHHNDGTQEQLGKEKMPFVPHGHDGNDTLIMSKEAKTKKDYYLPPDAFTTTAKITSSSEFIINVNSSEAHEHDSSSKKSTLPSIPYLECNNIGASTPFIQNHATFRNFPKLGAHPTTYTKTRGMIIPLSPIEIKTKGSSSTSTSSDNKKNNSAKHTQTFYPGDVIWSDGGEYMMTAPIGSNSDVSVLILNVDKKYIESQTNKGMLFGSHIGNYDCTIRGGDADLEETNSYSNGGIDSIINSNEGNLNLVTAFVKAVKKLPTRRVILSSIGLGLSTFTAVFLSKVAPLQLAVGVGGLCVVAGGTYATILGGEWLCDEATNIWENRSTDDDDDDDDNDLNDLEVLLDEADSVADTIADMLVASEVMNSKQEVGKEAILS
jgi:hypothetical protein